MSDTAPQSVGCMTCGGTAHRCAWGRSSLTAYRCESCHAGGHVTEDGARHGGVFEPLNNYATRRVIAA